MAVGRSRKIKNEMITMERDKEVQLEQLLAQAFEEPAYRAQFIEELLQSDIYIPGQTTREAAKTNRQFVLEQAESIQVKSWPNEEYGQVIPFFSSLEKMRLVFGAEENYLQFSCKVFFETTLGSLLVLNPESPIQKIFYPEEVGDILKGGEHATEAYEIQEDTEILIGQPNEMPAFMLDQLAKLLEQYPEVGAAYFAQIQKSTPELMLSYIIALRFSDVLETDKINKLHQHISQVALDSMEEKQTIDLLHIDEQKPEGLYAYFLNETTPFYVKLEQKKKGFFAKLFS